MGMTRDEYEGKRSILHERMVAADEEIHKQEKNCDEDVRLGDQKAFQYHDNCMKSAEGDFNRASEEVHQLDADYWDSSSKDASASNDFQNTVQNENADYWAAENAGNSSSNEQGNENSLSNEASR